MKLIDNIPHVRVAGMWRPATLAPEIRVGDRVVLPDGSYRDVTRVVQVERTVKVFLHRPLGAHSHRKYKDTSWVPTQRAEGDVHAARIKAERAEKARLLADLGTSEGKEAFIRRLIEGVREKVLADVAKMPTDWSAFQLRRYISDAFAAEQHMMPTSMRIRYESAAAALREGT